MSKSKSSNTKRYFIVFYSAITNEGLVTGYVDFTTAKGAYLNKAKTLIQLGENSFKFRDIIIKNIIELSEKDFQDWTLDI